MRCEQVSARQRWFHKLMQVMDALTLQPQTDNNPLLSFATVRPCTQLHQQYGYFRDGNPPRPESIPAQRTTPLDHLNIGAEANRSSEQPPSDSNLDGSEALQQPAIGGMHA